MNPDKFISKWNTYLNDLETLCNAKFEHRTSTPYTQHLLPLLKKVIEELREAKEDVIEAVGSELASKDNSKAIEYLGSEFDFFNALVESLTKERDNGTLSGYDDGERLLKDDLADDVIDNAIGAGKTIKDSFEKLLKRLPEKWKRSLKILNEVLSLVKVG